MGRPRKFTKRNESTVAGRRRKDDGVAAYKKDQGTVIPLAALRREAKSIIIKSGMKLVYDDELNRMVWK